MSEKVIYEVRLIETEDGLRIEMKGDKERMREFVHRKRMRHFGHREEWREWSRWGREFGRSWCFGPWWCDEPESKDEPKAESPSASGTL